MCYFFFFKQKTAYEVRISDWSSDVCSSDLPSRPHGLRLVVDTLLGELAIQPRVELEVDAMPSTLSLVEAGEGYTLLSYGPARHLIEAGRMKSWTVVNPTLSRQLILVTSSQRPTTAATRALAQMIRNQVRRSEEHTSELQALMRTSYAVFCLKKKKHNS